MYGMALKASKEKKAQTNDDDVPCLACGRADGESDFVLCENGCPTGGHYQCLGMAAVPEGDWFCDACAEARREKYAADAARAAAAAAGEDPSPGKASPPPPVAIADPAAADPEDPDPRLAMKSLRDMVEYYYNAWLTLPNVEDDDGDRSACSDDEETNPFVAAAAAKRRGGGSGGKTVTTIGTTI